MFETLSQKLTGALSSLSGQKRLSESDVETAMREIRVALLEADVALPVVKEFVADIKGKATGQDIIKGVNPGQQVVKIVSDAMEELLGSENAALALEGTPPLVYLMAGLQGSGKTTSTAKIAKFLSDKHRKKVLMASLDTQRPAAQEQLAVLGQQTGIATLEIIKGQNPLEITRRAMETGRLEGYDIIMLDTAGRLSIDEELMNEVAAVKDVANPAEILLVADAMTGQDAVQTAQAFDERLGLTGIMLTRIDGDARGGAAMSMRAITGKPIKLLGTGEKWDAIEPFHPDRIAGRILGMGDVVSLVEKAVETIDQKAAEDMAEKFQKGQFDFDDMLSQFKQMKNMGGIGSLAKMLPGMGKMMDQVKSKVDDNALKHQEAMIQSMTKAERAKPALLNASRKRRIAQGSGTTVQDVNKLIKQHAQMHSMMKKVRKMGMGGMMKAMSGMMGGDAMDKLTKGMGEEDMQQLQSMMGEQGGGDNPLGANPFASPDMGALGGMPGMLPPGMGGRPSKRGVTKKIKKRKKK